MFTAFGISGECVPHLLGMCCSWASAWQSFGICLAFAWQLLGICVACAWHLLGIDLACAWHLLGICLASAYYFLGIGWYMQRFRGCRPRPSRHLRTGCKSNPGNPGFFNILAGFHHPGDRSRPGWKRKPPGFRHHPRGMEINPSRFLFTATADAEQTSWAVFPTTRIMNKNGRVSVPSRARVSKKPVLGGGDPKSLKKGGGNAERNRRQSKIHPRTSEGYSSTRM
jgi:hypothetical protein